MRDTILIADDIELNREILEEMLEDNYKVIQAENGLEVLELAEKHFPSLCCILLDLIMPQMDGYQTLDEMGKRGWLDTVPVLVISGDDSPEAEQVCFDKGVLDFIHKPFDGVVVLRRVNNSVNLYNYRATLRQQVEEQTKELTEKNALLEIQAARLRKSNSDIIDMLGTMVEARNLESGEHVKRVKGFTRIMARKMQELYPEYGLTDAKIEVIISASSLHDVGKIMIKDEVLLKPGRFTPEEFAYMKTHTTKGAEILLNMRKLWEEEYATVSYEICRWHHERCDGRGYPDGLKGDEIPISAQLVSVADVYDALVTERVYKKPFPPDVAFNMILNNECGVFSPKLMECFRAVRTEMEAFAFSGKHREYA